MLLESFKFHPANSQYEEKLAIDHDTGPVCPFPRPAQYRVPKRAGPGQVSRADVLLRHPVRYLAESRVTLSNGHWSVVTLTRLLPPGQSS